jgi:hypothetical protein
VQRLVDSLARDLDGHELVERHNELVVAAAQAPRQRRATTQHSRHLNTKHVTRAVERDAPRAARAARERGETGKCAGQHEVRRVAHEPVDQEREADGGEKRGEARHPRQAHHKAQQVVALLDKPHYPTRLDTCGAVRRAAVEL